jgi:hypothetical protein
MAALNVAQKGRLRLKRQNLCLSISFLRKRMARPIVVIGRVNSQTEVSQQSEGWAAA